MNDTAPAPAPARRRGIGRRGVVVALAACAVLLALLAGAIWFGGREAALVMLAHRIETASGGQLTVTGVRGSLYGAMHVDRVVLRSPERVIAAHGIDIAWSPSSLLRRTVAVDRLDVATLAIEQLKPSKEPLKLPATLALPLGLRVNVAQARVRELTVAAGGNRSAIANVLFGLAADSAQWTLRDASASTPWGRLTAQASVGARLPFAVRGKAHLAAPEAVADLAADGDLRALQLALNGHGRGARATIRMALAPFEPLILRTLDVDAEGVNPFLWDQGWPKADFKALIHAGIGTGGAVTGDLALDNRAAPGPLDRQQVPLRRLAARLRGDLDLLRLDGVLIDLGGAGRFAGAGTVAGKNGKNAATRFVLHTDRIDLREVLASLHPTHIAGDMVLASQGQTGTLDVHLGQDGFLLDAQAALANAEVALRHARLRVRGSSVDLAGTLGLQGARPFAASGTVAHVNPADFGKFPQADLNTAFKATGSAASAWKVAAQFALQPSRLFGQPLSGRGKLQADARHVDAVDVQLALGANALAAQGSFGAAGDKLNWRLDGKQLGALDARLGGAASAQGVATGTYAAPASTFTVSASDLRWEKTRGTARNDGSTLQAGGDVVLRNGAPDLRMRGQVRRFDPSALSALGALPEGRIDADFAVAGRVAKDWAGTLDLTLQPSTLLGAPLNGYAKVAADARHVSRADVDLRLAANHLTAQGRYGAPGDSLSWRLDAPQLDALGAQFGGALQAAGVMAGTPAAPTVRVNASGTKLKFGAHTIQTASLNVDASATPGTPLSAHLALTGYRAPQPVFDTFSADLSGTSLSHLLRVAAKSPDLDASGEVAGAWRDGEWTGAVRALQNRGRNAIALQAPAPLRFSVLRGAGGKVALERLALSNAVLKLGRGTVTLQSLEKDGPHWKSSGAATGLLVRQLANFVPALDDVVAGDMAIGATWNADLGAELNGALRIVRESGDLALGSDLPVLLGLSVFDARLTLAANALQAQLDMQGTRSGTLHLDAGARLVQEDGKWRLGDASPLRLNGSAAMDSVAWLGPLVGPVGLDLGGRLTMSVSGAGTVGAPQLSGQLAGDNLAVNWPDQGVKLRNGQLRATLAGEQLILQTLRFDGDQGTLRAEGGMRFADKATTMQVKLVADKLQVLSRPDRVLVVSGEAGAHLANKRLDIDGKFRADRAEIELARSNGLTMSDDVVVIRGGKAPAARAAKAPLIGLALDVEADLGNAFHLSGMGLDATLGGAVHIRSRPGDLPRATGTIRVEKGTYQAYGQDLAIERGSLSFNGPLDNPSLNILAMRRPEDKTRLFTGASEGVEAGVELRGTVKSPVAKLVSTPNVPDSEKLSWLVLGHGTAGSSAKEFDLLGAAAGALFSSQKASALQGRLAGSLGLDTIGLSTASGLENTVLTVGKRLSDRLFLTFERGTSSASNLVKLNYAVSRRVSVQLQAGANTAFDLLYSWAFD
jgi:translocation and assembly module TamB